MLATEAMPPCNAALKLRIFPPRVVKHRTRDAGCLGDPQAGAQKHLEAHKIERATIDSIGDGRKLTLRSFGIETAWDVKRQSILAVPGFGSALTGKLIDWRRSVEQRLGFNPNQPTEQSPGSMLN